MNLAYRKPPEEKVYYWVEREESLPVFLGPFATQEEAVEAGREWWNRGNWTPEHAHITLVTNEGGVWDLVIPICTFGSIFFC